MVHHTFTSVLVQCCQLITVSLICSREVIQWINSSFCNTRKPSFSWPSSLKIAISSHILLFEISNYPFHNNLTSCRQQIIIQEVHLETSDSSTMRLVTALTISSLPYFWPKDFVWCLTSNNLFTPYEMYCSTLRAIDINGGSIKFVNNSPHWLVIKQFLSMFDYKSYIHMARLVPEWSSEWDKKTPDLVLAIRAVILGFLYTSSVGWPYIQIFIQTWAYICRCVCIWATFQCRRLSELCICY